VPPWSASATMMIATMTSGQPVPVPKTPQRGEKNGEMSKHLVAGADPSRTHVGVAITEAHSSPKDAALARSAAVPTAARRQGTRKGPLRSARP
jgi:hypothetical protein